MTPTPWTREELAERLQDAVDGLLAPETQAAFEQGLEGHEDLRREYRELKDLRVVLADLGLERAPAGLSDAIAARIDASAEDRPSFSAPFRQVGWLRGAAAVLILAVVGTILWQESPFYRGDPSGPGSAPATSMVAEGDDPEEALREGAAPEAGRRFRGSDGALSGGGKVRNAPPAPKAMRRPEESAGTKKDRAAESEAPPESKSTWEEGSKGEAGEAPPPASGALQDKSRSEADGRPDAKEQGLRRLELREELLVESPRTGFTLRELRSLHTLREQLGAGPGGLAATEPAAERFVAGRAGAPEPGIAVLAAIAGAATGLPSEILDSRGLQSLAEPPQGPSGSRPRTPAPQPTKARRGDRNAASTEDGAQVVLVTGEGMVRRVRARLAAHPGIRIQELATDGTDLEAAPGPVFWLASASGSAEGLRKLVEDLEGLPRSLLRVLGGPPGPGPGPRVVLAVFER